MPRLLVFITSVLCLLLHATPSAAQLLAGQYDWVLKRDRSEIKIYTAKVDDSKYRAVSGSMLVDGTVESLVGLVMDLASCQKWAAMCKSAQLDRRVSATEFFIYTVNDLPFPLRDRDAFSQVVWSRDFSTGIVRMKSYALSDYKSKVKGAVRITNAKSEWVFTPQSSGQVLVQSFVHVDPNGPVPAWIVNGLIVGSPYKTMRQMREIIEAGGYADYQPNF